MRKSFVVLLLMVLAISVVIIPAAAAQDATLGTQDNPIIWAFVPSSDSETVLAGASELTDLVQKDTGIYITPIVATDYSAVVEAVCNGKAQMAALNTFGYILASSRGCANVGVVSTRFGSAYYSGQIIVKAGSDIKTLDDLKGKTFCRPDAISTSGWIVPSITLRANGIDPDTDLKIVDAGGHPQVVTAVINGDCDAGATFVDARTDEQKPKPKSSPRLRRSPTTPSASSRTSIPTCKRQSSPRCSKSPPTRTMPSF